MRQVIDWKKIHEIAANDPEYEFHWKYDGSSEISLKEDVWSSVKGYVRKEQL